MGRWQKMLLVAGLVLAGTISSVIGLTTQLVSAGVDDFYFDKMEIDYYLSKDSDGRARLKVKETLTAIFPDHNQNHGIVRSIPLDYQKHPLSFELGQLLRNGQPANLYKNQTEKGFRTLTIRDQRNDVFLHGANVYEINYTMRDVTHKPSNARIDEFYWDTNGTGWRQRFNQLVARVHLDQSVYDRVLVDKIACYTGRLGQSERNCTTKVDEQNRLITFQTTQALPAKHNMTLAIGFQADTFAGYIVPTWKVIVAWSALVTSVLGLGLVLMTRWGLKNATRRQIAAAYPVEYLPPNLTIFANYHLYHDLQINPSKMLAIGLLDLAVRHKIKIVKFSARDKQSPEFGVELMSDQLTSDEGKFLNTVFQRSVEVGKAYKIKTKDYKLADRLKDFLGRIVKELRQSNMIDQAATEQLRQRAIRKLLLGGGLGAVGFGSLMFLGANEFGLPWFAVNQTAVSLLVVGQSVGVGLMVATLFGINGYHLFTKQGVELKTQLMGLKKYISMAEADRLVFNQSVQNAEVDIKDRVKLYEHLLPYAVMFGLEKSWAAVLKTVYQETSQSPTWSDETFAAATLSESLHQFNRTATTAATAVDYSSSGCSSDSGSSGGGSSGGGGGGGGGGGC